MTGIFVSIVILLLGIYTKITTYPGFVDGKKYWKILVVVGSLGLTLKIFLLWLKS